MKNLENIKEAIPDSSRRNFITILPLMMVGLKETLKPIDTNPLINLTEQDEIWTKNSSMAQDLNNYFGKGYSCAESGLMVGLNYFKKSKEILWLAAGYGGGLLHRDLCGFLTAGAMVLGLAAGELELERRDAKKWCTKRIKEYWVWWQKKAPLHCSKIRIKESNPAICKNLGLLTSAKIQELIST